MFEGQKITVGVWTGDNEGENGRRRVEAVGPITQDLVGLGNVLSPYCLQWDATGGWWCEDEGSAGAEPRLVCALGRPLRLLVGMDGER